MPFSFIAEMLRLIFLHCNKNPKLFVSFFDRSNFLIGYNYRRSENRFTHVSGCYTKILGYHLNSILCSGNFSSNIIHPQDEPILKEYLRIVPTFNINTNYFANQPSVRWTRCRAKHIKGYWKYFAFFFMDYRNSHSNTIDKIGIIADEHIKVHLQILKRNEDLFPMSISMYGKNLDQRNGNEDEVMISTRESEILEFISEGMIAKEIAAKLNISLNTVITHRKNLISKFGAHNTAELIKKATKLMLI